MADNRAEKEINLLELAQKLWGKKKFIIKVTLIGAVVGLIIAFSIPKEYTTTVSLVPEVESASSGTMGSLAALAGINLGDGVDVLVSPDLYPSILSSTSFLKGLYDIRVKDSELDIDTTLYSYLSNNQKQTWWSYIFKVPYLLRGLLSSEENVVGGFENSHLIISKEEMGIIGEFRDRIRIYSDKKTAITKIEITMQSPEISAHLADTLTTYFQSYIINYRTKKARNDLEYAEKLCFDAKDNYYRIQQQLAAYVDGNRNVVSAKYRISQERLQNEANLAYSVYNQTAQQLQLAKVKVQDNTPVFTIIQPAIQPLDPSNLSKKIIIIGFVFLSFISSSLWILRNDLKQLL